MYRNAPAVLALAGALVLAGCSDLATEPTPLAPEAALEQRGASGDAPDRGGENANRAPRPGALTIAEIVVASTEADEPEFTLLLAALGYIGETNPGSALLAGLFDADQYTVFAPTDAAFLGLVNAVAPLLDAEVLAEGGPFAAIDALLGDGTVEAVVSHHVTTGRRAANSVVPRMGMRTIETLLAGTTFSVSPAGVITAVGSTAGIVAADISASNGIVHIVDAVILPVDLGL